MFLTLLQQIKTSRGREEMKNSHLQPSVGITTRAIRISKQDPRDHDNCNENNRTSESVNVKLWRMIRVLWILWVFMHFILVYLLGTTWKSYGIGVKWGVFVNAFVSLLSPAYVPLRVKVGNVNTNLSKCCLLGEGGGGGGRRGSWMSLVCVVLVCCEWCGLCYGLVTRM